MLKNKLFNLLRVILITLLFNFGLDAKLQKVTSSKKNFTYTGAGVVPYAVHNGKTYLLIGKERTGLWSGFGGYKDKSDNNYPMVTAAREAAEELSLIFDNDKNFSKILKGYKKFKTKFNIAKSGSDTYSKFLNSLKKPNTYEIVKTNFICYFTKINYDSNLPAKFQKRQKKSGLPHQLRENSKIEWVELDKFISGLKRTNNNTNVIVGAQVKRKLRPVLAAILRIATPQDLKKYLK